MKRLTLVLCAVSATALLTSCGVATTTYTPAYTTATTYRVAYPVKTVRAYPVRRVGVGYPVSVYADNYYPSDYWNTGYYYPYRYGTNVLYGGTRVYSSWWGI